MLIDLLKHNLFSPDTCCVLTFMSGDRQTDGQTDGQADKQTHGQKDGRTDGCTHMVTSVSCWVHEMKSFLTKCLQQHNACGRRNTV